MASSPFHISSHSPPDNVDTADTADTEPLFRPSKNLKRKHQRRKPSSPSPRSTPDPEPETEDQIAPKNLAQTYKPPPRKRAGGIEFSTSTSVRKDVSASTAAKAKAKAVEEAAAAAEPVSTVPEMHSQPLSQPLSLPLSLSRFTPSTGAVSRMVDEERDLMAYIDSHMHNAPLHTPVQNTTPNTAHNPTSTPLPAKQPAIAGRLQEIDLGPSARRKNEKATRKASRKLAADGSWLSSEEEESDSDRPRKRNLPPKVRVNKQGKVLPPRRPRRGLQRSVEDVERDRVVEEMLRSEGSAGRGLTMGCDGERDEELVERFRREYTENSMAAAAGKQNASTSVKGAGAAVGPKMGGSRSLRAGKLGSGQGRGKGK